MGAGITVSTTSGAGEGDFFEALFRRLVPRLGYNKAIWAVVHRGCATSNTASEAVPR
jgi:hypothetical protein